MDAVEDTSMATIETELSPPHQPRKLSWYRRATTKIYLAHAITTWGDRMWSFAISLFLVKMSFNNELRLAAIYGLVCCGSSIIFGGVVGKWVDNNARLTVAWKSLVTQNSLVVMCSVLLGGLLFNLEKLKQLELQWLLILLQGVVITLGAGAYLASVACNISISKDWVVVIAKKDKNKLATINAMCRRIDLSTKICSPMLVGLIMAQLSDVAATIFIASWNVFSMMAEFFLLLSIYNQVPELSVKSSAAASEEPEEKHVSGLAPLAEEEVSLTDSITLPQQKVESHLNPPKRQNWLVKNVNGYCKLWKNYFCHPIFPAGLGLACLYMTVLAFDAITIGYSFSQGVSELILGSLGGAGAVTGIIGTMFYPLLRRKIGIERTGLVGFFLEISCLSLCVASVWAPGSPFEPSSILSAFKTSHQAENSLNDTSNVSYQRDYTSVILLMTGIVSARVGLWMTDMTINQIIQEEVEDNERGSINGIQHSLNMMMDLNKYTLVIMLPSPNQFGYLVLASFFVICLGWLSYAVYSRKIRHHILPFHRYFKGHSNQPIPELTSKKEDLK